MIVKLLTEHHLEFPSFKGGCTGLSESTLVKIPHCWKSHVAAHMLLNKIKLFHIGSPSAVSALSFGLRPDKVASSSAYGPIRKTD